MLNPITAKLQKMPHRSRKNRGKNMSRTPHKLFTTSFRVVSNQENDLNLSNNTSRAMITPWKSALPKTETSQLDITERTLEKCLEDNERLKEQIKTHEMMQEFYLKELEIRKKEKKNLQWRLSVLSEELEGSNRRSASKNNRELFSSNILSRKVELARQGLQRQTESQPFSQR